MIKWDLVIPQATFLTSSFSPRLSRKVRRAFLISAPLDLKDSSHSALVLALLAYRRVTEGWGAERCMCMPRLSNELIIEAQIDERFVYSSPFFHTGMPALFHRRNGFKSRLLFTTNCNSEVQKSVWSPSNYCCANKQPSAGLKLDEPTFPTFICLISNF